MSLEDDIVTDQILEQVETNGVATVSVKDGRVMVFSLDKLKSIVDNVEKAGKHQVLIFIQDPKSLN